MHTMFGRPTLSAPHRKGFEYVEPGARYLDSACQTLRPQEVIDAETAYYREYNACGGRVKYRWGQRVDEAVGKARAALLKATGKNAHDYAVAFTLNTTYGINLVMHQLPENTYGRVVTSEIEHNSVMIPSMTWSKRRGVPLSVLPRTDDGALSYDARDLEGAVVLLNNMSNIDGRTLRNAHALATDTHAKGGILLVDAAQGFAHDDGSLKDLDFDAAFGSGHKAYGPSLGFIVIRRSLLSSLDHFFLGGGTVSDVHPDGFDVLKGEQAHDALEPGLQNWGGIIGFEAALRWFQTQDRAHETRLAQHVWEGLRAMPRIKPLNTHPSTIVSFSVEGLDAHKLALLLSEQGIMCRSGYFCCHRYLLHQRNLPPQLRISLGLNNTMNDVDAFLSSLNTILSTF